MAKVATNQERLNQLFDLDSRNDTQIAMALGVSKQTVSSWRLGTRSPKLSVLKRIAEEYGTTVEWLLGWDLPAPSILTTVISTNEIPNPRSLSDEEWVLVQAYRKASDNRKAVIMELLAKYIDKKEE